MKNSTVERIAQNFETFFIDRLPFVESYSRSTRSARFAPEKEFFLVNRALSNQLVSSQVQEKCYFYGLKLCRQLLKIAKSSWSICIGSQRGRFYRAYKSSWAKIFFGHFSGERQITGGFVSRWEKCFRWTLNEPKLSHNGPKINIILS